MFIIYFYGQFSIAMLVYWMINMMIYLLNMVIFQFAMLVYWRVCPIFRHSQFDSVRHPSRPRRPSYPSWNGGGDSLGEKLRS